jgi:cobalt transporter subunit CbtA
LLKRILAAALGAGFVAGLLLSVMHILRLDPLIAAAERYEASHPGHEAVAAAWEPHGWQRPALTFLASLVIGAGFGLVLSGIFALRQAASGTSTDAREGVLWGIAGFAAFALAPAAELPPVPPGMESAGIVVRQAWWLATALGTAAGLGALVLRRGALWRTAGAALIVLPHVVGPPAPPSVPSAVPAELVGNFVASSLVAAALFWVTLGSVCGWIYGAFDGDRARLPPHTPHFP